MPITNNSKFKLKQYLQEVLDKNKKKKIKVTQTDKKEIKELNNLFSDVLNSCLETLKAFTKNLFKLWDIKSTKPPKEMKEIPPVIASSQIKFLGGNFNEETKDLYAENCKTQIKVKH